VPRWHWRLRHKRAHVPLTKVLEDIIGRRRLQK